MEICKGKSVVKDSSIPVPEDIFESNFILHIDFIGTRNLEGGQKHKSVIPSDEERPCYYVSISLEENLVDGRHWCKDTEGRYKSLIKKQLRWDCEGIWFRIDLMKIHVTDLKLEVIQHYDVRRVEVGTSTGTRVVGRARIPLWDFLKGNKTVEELECGDEKRSNCVQVGKVERSGPKAQGDPEGEKKCETLEELLGGEEKRSKRVHLTKMEGSVAKPQGVLQVNMRVEKAVVRRKKRKRGKKQAAARPIISLRPKMLRAK